MLALAPLRESPCPLKTTVAQVLNFSFFLGCTGEKAYIGRALRYASWFLPRSGTRIKRSGDGHGSQAKELSLLSRPEN